MPAVSLIDPLDDLLAPLMLEIHIDVRRLVAVLGDKALKQKSLPHRIDGGDAKAITDGGVRGGPSPLAKDVLRAGIADDAVDGEEIRRIAHALDQVQLVPDLDRDLVGNPIGIAASGSLPGQGLKPVLRSYAINVRLGRVSVGKLVEREPAPSRNLARPSNSLRVMGKEASRFLGRTQLPARMALATEPQGLDRAFETDRRHHVLQHAPAGLVVEHVA